VQCLRKPSGTDDVFAVLSRLAGLNR